MEIMSFVFGILAMVVVLFVIIIVAGIVKIRRLSQDVSSIFRILEDSSRNYEEEHKLISDRIDEAVKESVSYTDKRVDLLLNKIKQ